MRWLTWKAKWYGLQLRRMEDFALVQEIEAMMSRCKASLSGKIRGGGSPRLLWWLANSVVAGTRDTVQFDQMLRGKDRDGLLTREQVSTVTFP